MVPALGGLLVSRKTRKEKGRLKKKRQNLIVAINGCGEDMKEKMVNQLCVGVCVHGHTTGRGWGRS